jgi:hypothetical protein
MKYVIALNVHVTVEASSPYEAERLAFQQADTLRKSAGAWVSAAQVVRTVGDVSIPK